jgi:hypothetical protein
MSGRRAKDARRAVVALLRYAEGRERYDASVGQPGGGAAYIRRTVERNSRPPAGAYTRGPVDLDAPRPWGSTRRGRSIPKRWLRRRVRLAQEG